MARVVPKIPSVVFTARSRFLTVPVTADERLKQIFSWSSQRLQHDNCPVDRSHKETFLLYQAEEGKIADVTVSYGLIKQSRLFWKIFETK